MSACRPDRFALRWGVLPALHQPRAGALEAALTIRPLEPRRVSSTYATVAGRAVRDFGPAHEGLLGIAAHVLRERFGRRLVARGLGRTVAVTVEAALEHRDSGESFAARRPATIGEVGPDLDVPHRRDDILDYAAALRRGEDLGPAIYASGAALQALAGDRDWRATLRAQTLGSRRSRDALWMLDGARRLTAAALAHRATYPVVLVLEESQLPMFLPASSRDELARRSRELGWFASYQDVPLVGLKGERTTRRFDLIEPGALLGASVVDFGCNLGAACHRAIQFGARGALGLEGTPDTCRLAQDIATATRLEGLRIEALDFNDKALDRKLESLLPEPADLAFFFSVYRTKELTQRERLFRAILRSTRRGVYFEGHADPKIDTLDYHRWLFDCFGVRGWRHLGYSEAGDLRPLFWLPRS